MQTGKCSKTKNARAPRKITFAGFLSHTSFAQCRITAVTHMHETIIEPRRKKNKTTCLRGFRLTGLYSQRGLKFQIKKVEGSYYEAKTNALISCAVTAKLICAFVFAYAKSRFSHDAANFLLQQVKHQSDLGRVFTSKVSSPNLARQRKNMPV